jgi:hypothetical protein
VAIDRSPDSLGIETPERRLSTGLAWLFAGARVSADIAVEVPWGAKVRFETMSGSVEAMNLVGDQKYRTVSGDIRLWSLGGLVEASTISGGITLDGGAELRLRATTISGGIKARAAVFHSLSMSTTSGNMMVVGVLDPAGDHRAESISGGVELTPLSGVTVELKTVSGSVHSDFEPRVDGARGFWRAIVGDGRANLRLNTTSGSLRLLAPRPSDTVPAPAAAPAAPASPAAPAAPAAPDAPLGAESATGADGIPSTATPPAEAAGEDSAESWNPDESADGGEVDEDELAVLQALERGEIGVDEAAARLERTGR